MLKHQVTPPPLMRVHRDNSAHLPSPRPRRHSNDRLQGNKVTLTRNLDDMIDALDHDLIRLECVSSADTEATATDSRTSQLLS